MRIFGMLIGGIIALFGLSIMITPLRTYFLIGWIIGLILLCNGVSMLFSGIKMRSRSKKIAGLTTTLIGVILLVTDVQQILTQMIIVYIVAGGIMIVGLIECLIGYTMVKNEQGSPFTLIMGVISFLVGLFGLIFQDATVIVIGLIVGYHIIRIGLSVFTFARNMNKPIILEADQLPYD